MKTTQLIEPIAQLSERTIRDGKYVWVKIPIYYLREAAVVFPRMTSKQGESLRKAIQTVLDWSNYGDSFDNSDTIQVNYSIMISEDKTAYISIPDKLSSQEIQNIERITDLYFSII